MRHDVSGRRVASLVAVLLLAMTAGLSAQTLPDALVKAYHYNPTLAISRAQLRQADEAVEQARSDLLPDVTGSVSGTASTQSSARDPGNGFTDSTALTGRASVDGQVTLWSFGRTQAQIDSAVASVKAARAELVSVEQDVLLEAVTAFLDVRRDGDFVDLARNNARVITEQLRATQDRFDVGEVTRTDVSQAEAALAAARANLAANTGALARSRASYLAAVGEPAGKLAMPPPIPALPKTLEEAETIAMREHPILVASRFAEEAAQFDVVLAQAGLNPLLTLSSSVFYEHERITSQSVEPDDTLSATLEIELQVPLYRGGELSSLIRRAQEILNQRKAQTQDRGRQIRASVQNSWSGLEVARASIRANREQIAAAQLAFEGVVEEAKFGERTTLDVLDAEQQLLEARSNLVSAQRDEYVAAYNLLSAMGLLTVSHLGLGVSRYDPEAAPNAVRLSPSGPEGLRLEKILDRWGN